MAAAGGRYSFTDLAELEGLAQPTTTLLVKQLEGQGLVRRERQKDDQRVVQQLRALAAAGLRRHLDAMPDHQLKALAAATDALAELIATLQSDTPRHTAAQPS